MAPSESSTEAMEETCRKAARLLGLTTTELRRRLNELRHTGLGYQEAIDALLAERPQQKVAKEPIDILRAAFRGR